MKVNVFTDGACSENPGPGGWAAVFALSKSIKVISGGEEKTTNNRMELMSVVKAIETAKEKGIDELVINSDSSYVVNAVNLEWLRVWESKNWINSKGEDVKNKDLWERLLQVIRSYDGTVTFVKVKGHKGITLNELADEVARNEVSKIKAKLSYKW